ncbi:MAG: M50 family metallopeptidase [Nannocystaceae bacterium]|nr:site-2 protease family protein [Myxococcales bacterium]
MSILGAVLLLSVLIIVHEFGHFIFAVATGMKVDRFSVIGIGPPVLRLFTWRGTEFVIAAIPFGAYVHIVGMEAPDAAELAEEKRAREACLAEGKEDETKYLFRNRPVWARILTILGGPLANYVAAMVIVFALFSVAGARDASVAHVDQVLSETAQQAGVTRGDVLVSIGGDSVQGGRAFNKVEKAAGDHKGTTAPIVVERAGETVTLDVPIDENGKIGIQMTNPYVPVSIGQAAYFGVREPIEITKAQLSGLYKVIVGKDKAEVGGPVAIVNVIKQSADEGLRQFVWMGAFISTILGMFNLLPIPALDGGRLAFLGVEAIIRKRASPNLEEKIHGYGMLALLVLILIVTIRDIGKLFG